MTEDKKTLLNPYIMIIDKRDTWKYFKNGLREECQKDEMTYQTHVFLQYHIFSHLM